MQISGILRAVPVAAVVVAGVEEDAVLRRLEQRAVFYFIRESTFLNRKSGFLIANQGSLMGNQDSSNIHNIIILVIAPLDKSGEVLACKIIIFSTKPIIFSTKPIIFSV